MQALCHEFDATLLVDVAHDLGGDGPERHAARSASRACSATSTW